jgi:hypothetical protein
MYGRERGRLVGRCVDAAGGREDVAVIYVCRCHSGGRSPSTLFFILSCSSVQKFWVLRESRSLLGASRFP